VLLISIFSVNVFADSETSYVHFNGKILFSDNDGEIEYYFTDYLGNVVVKTDSEGDILWEADYTPFGDTFNEEGVSDYTVTGKELDDTGLNYFGARYYDGEIGRFISADSVEGNFENPQTLNRYSFVLNNPLKYVDPSGNVPTDSTNVNNNYQEMEDYAPWFRDRDDIHRNLFNYAGNYYTRFITEADSFHYGTKAEVKAGALSYGLIKVYKSSEGGSYVDFGDDSNVGIDLGIFETDTKDGDLGIKYADIKKNSDGSGEITVKTPGLNLKVDLGKGLCLGCGASGYVTFYYHDINNQALRPSTYGKHNWDNLFKDDEGGMK